jgi:hypothetical protein
MIRAAARRPLVPSPFSTEEPLPEIAPFAGIRYRVPDADLPKVLAPPYDVIPPSYQDELYARDPRNIVRVVLNREPGDEAYRVAGDTWRRLQADGVAVADDAPSLYVVEQTFTAEGATLTRLGLLARFRATDASAGQVLPHEHTRAAAKEDRYKLLKATRANFSPIFMMSEDPGGRFAAALSAATAGAPVATYTDDSGVAHRMWRVTDAREVAGFQQALGKPKAYIADGHHRYATALRYRDEVAREGEWTFGYFTPLDSPGMLVLPYHRLLVEGPTLAEARDRLRGAFLVNDSKDAASAGRAGAGGRGVAGGGGPAAPGRAPEPEGARHVLRAPGRAAAPRSRRRRRALRALAGRGEGVSRARPLPPGAAAARDARAPDRRRGGGEGVDAREEHLLPPEGAVRPGGASAARVGARTRGAV